MEELAMERLLLVRWFISVSLGPLFDSRRFSFFAI